MGPPREGRREGEVDRDAEKIDPLRRRISVAERSLSGRLRWRFVASRGCDRAWIRLDVVLDYDEYAGIRGVNLDDRVTRNFPVPGPRVLKDQLHVRGILDLSGRFNCM
jgi:hypothetical protein